MKVYICYKALSNCIQIPKKAFKKQKPITPYLVVPGGKRKTIKVAKVLFVKCAPVNFITKAIVMTECLLVTYCGHH